MCHVLGLSAPENIVHKMWNSPHQSSSTNAPHLSTLKGSPLAHFANTSSRYPTHFHRKMPPTLLLLLLFLSRLQKRQRYSPQLSSLGKRRRDRRIPRVSLQRPSMSAFTFLYQSGNDQALITLTGFDFRAFHYILNSFAPVYKSYSPYSDDGCVRLLPTPEERRGRPRSLTATQCLGLVLAWGRTRGSVMVLSLLFGITGSVCSLFLRFGRRVLLKVLSTDSKAYVKMPSSQEIIEFQSAIGAKYSMLNDVYCVADGLKLYLEQSGNEVIQNMFYNGWTHDHYVGNIFVFAPNGVIIACALNAPGAMHDSSISDWGGIYHKLHLVYERCRAKCVVDSAFSNGEFSFLIKSSQDQLSNSDGNSALYAQLRQATSMRQSAEWGMRALKGTFPRLKDRFKYEENGERKITLQTIVLLFNLRTRIVGINEILSTFMPHLSVEANHFLSQHIGL